MMGACSALSEVLGHQDVCTAMTFTLDFPSGQDDPSDWGVARNGSAAGSRRRIPEFP